MLLGPDIERLLLEQVELDLKFPLCPLVLGGLPFHGFRRDGRPVSCAVLLDR